MSLRERRLTMSRVRARAWLRLVRIHQPRLRIRGENDLLAAHSLLSARLGAPLTHPDAVPEAVAFYEADLIGLGDGFEESAGQCRSALGRAGVTSRARLLAAHAVTRAG